MEPNTQGFDDIVAKVVAAQTVIQGATVFVREAKSREQEAVRVAVTEALANDDLTDQQKIDAVVAAAGVSLQPFLNNIEELSGALLTNTPSAPLQAKK